MTLPRCQLRLDFIQLLTLHHQVLFQFQPALPQPIDLRFLLVNYLAARSFSFNRLSQLVLQLLNGALLLLLLRFKPRHFFLQGLGPERKLRYLAIALSNLFLLALPSFGECADFRFVFLDLRLETTLRV